MSLASGSLLQQAQTTTYFNVASIVVLVHDWFLTIDSELAFIWNAKWNLGTFLYILTRYPAFIDTAVYLYGAIGHAIPVPVCGLVMAVSGWMFLFGFGISEVVMAICVWTMWGRTRRMAISLATLALAVTVVAVLGLHKHHSSATYIPLEDLHPNVPGCQTRPGGTRDALFIDFIALASLESVLFILMLSKAVQHSRVRSSTFVLECFRHGLIYYMMLSILSVFNIAVILRGAHEFSNLLTSIQRTFHAILSARMLLHLRRAAHQTRRGPGDTFSISLDVGMDSWAGPNGPISGVGDSGGGKSSIV